MTLLTLPQISQKEGEVEVCFVVAKRALLPSPVLQVANDHHAVCRAGPSQSD